MSSPELFNLTQACKITGLKRQVLQKYVRKKWLIPIHISNRKFFSHNSLDVLIKKRAEIKEFQRLLNGHDGYIGITALSKKTGISRPTIYRYIEQGFKGIKLKAQSCSLGTLICMKEWHKFKQHL